MKKDKYPLFCGKVVSVPAILEQGSTIYTLVDYLTIKDEPSEGEVRQVFFSKLLGLKEGVEKKEQLEKKVKRASIPMRLDPSVIDGCDIRARFGQLQIDEEGTKVKTYEVEVIKGRRDSSGDIFSALAQPRHTGFRYIRILEE